MVVTLGEILVEILAVERSQSLRSAGTLIGPYPSGAPAIFIDQVARLGQPAAIIGRVGNDDFGWLNIERLRADGVEVSSIEIDADRPTGTAFVSYQPSGDRHFVFNVKHSASGCLALGDAADRVLRRCDHFHVMGSSLFSPSLIEVMRGAIERAKSRGATISFDPNIRTALLPSSDLATVFAFVLDRCDLLIPTTTELFHLTGETREEPAISQLLQRDIQAIVVKRGADGASYHDRSGATHADGFAVEEIDPTGAGDCFGATFVVCRLRGMSVSDSLRYANASGARTVTFRGPMEGTAGYSELDSWLEQHTLP